MSAKTISVPTSVIACELCGEPIDTYSGRDRAALNWGTTPLAERANPNPKHFLFFRHGSGERTSGAAPRDYRTWTWDFHGECLVGALKPLVGDGIWNQSGSWDDDEEDR